MEEVTTEGTATIQQLQVKRDLTSRRLPHLLWQTRTFVVYRGLSRSERKLLLKLNIRCSEYFWKPRQNSIAVIHDVYMKHDDNIRQHSAPAVVFSLSALVATHPLLQDYFLQPFYGLETSTTPLHWYLASLLSHYNIAMGINIPIRTNITISAAHSSILDFAMAQNICKASSENFTWAIKTIQFNKWKKK